MVKMHITPPSTFDPLIIEALHIAARNLHPDTGPTDRFTILCALSVLDEGEPSGREMAAFFGTEGWCVGRRSPGRVRLGYTVFLTPAEYRQAKLDALSRRVRNAMALKETE